MVINKEPQIIEYYNGLPEYATMIDKLNIEYFDLIKENNDLENKHKYINDRLKAELNESINGNHKYKQNLIYGLILVLCCSELTIVTLCITFI